MTVMKLPFTFIDRLGSSVEYKYLPASTWSFLYCFFFFYRWPGLSITMSMFDVCSYQDFAISPVVNLYYCVAIISSIQAWEHFSFARCLVGWYVNKELETSGRKQSWANPSTILDWPERTEEDRDYIWISSDLNFELLHYNSECQNMNQFFRWHGSHSFLSFHR